MNKTPLQETMERELDNLALSLDKPETLAKLQEFMTFSRSFYKYSFRNQWLIHMQNRNASYVKGFNDWIKIGRCVKKGEKCGIRILAPMIAKDKANPDKKRLFGFKEVCVFDIKQTEGKDIPSLVKMQGENLAKALPALEAYSEKLGFPIKKKDLAENLGGYADGKEIVIATDRGANTAFKTIVHELAHNIIHFKDGIKRDEVSAQQAEAEAELTAHLVMTHFGVNDVLTAAYLKGWKATGETLRKAFQNVNKITQDIIEAIAPTETEAEG